MEERLARNSLIILFGNVTSKMMVFLLVPFYTSVLSTTEYAVSDLFTTTVNLIFPLLSLSITQGVLRFCLDKEKEPDQVFNYAKKILAISSTIATIVSLIALRYTVWSEYRFLFALYYIAYSYNALLLQYAKGTNRVLPYSIAGCLNTITLIVVNVIFLVILRVGIKGYLIAMVLSNAASAAYLFIRCGLMKREKISAVNKELKKEMLRYSLPLIPGAVSWWINTSADRYILTACCTLSELGVYSVAFKIPNLQYMLMSALMGAWEISAVEGFGTEENRALFSNAYKKYTSMLIVLSCLVSMTAKPLSFILYQKDFFTAWHYVPILSIASVFEILSLFVGTVFTSAKKTKYIFYTTLAGAMLNVLMNLLLIPRIGALGAALATAGSFVLVYTARLVLSRKILNLDFSMFRYHFGLLGTVLTAGLVCLDNPIAYLVGGIICLLNYKAIVEVLSIVYRIFYKIIRKGKR